MEDIDQIITNIVVGKLQRNIVPWQKTWQGRTKPYKYSNGKPYRGINLLLLNEGGEYIPQKEYEKLKESHNVTEITEPLWETVIYSFKVNGEWGRVSHKVAHIKYFSNIPSRLPQIKLSEYEPKRSVEEVLKKYMEDYCIKVLYSKGGDQVYYKDGQITIPNPEQFTDSNNYYLNFFHECIHSTAKILKRSHYVGIRSQASYSLEELTAEIGACRLMDFFGVPYDIHNSEAYIKGWCNQFLKYKKMISIANFQATHAVNLILGKNPEHELFKLSMQ